MMTRDEYAAWWREWSNKDDLPEPVNTLVEHIWALQERIDALPEEHRCACAYEDPRARCAVHAPKDYSRDAIAVDQTVARVQSAVADYESEQRDARLRAARAADRE